MYNDGLDSHHHMASFCTAISFRPRVQPRVRSPPRTLEPPPVSSLLGSRADSRIRSLSESSDSHVSAETKAPKAIHSVFPSFSNALSMQATATVPGTIEDRVLHDPNYLRAMREIKTVCEGKLYSTTVKDIKQEVFDRLVEKTEGTPLIIDYNRKTGSLFVKCPLFPHEVAAGITTAMLVQTRPGYPKPDYGGSSHVELLDGTIKSPDFGIYDPRLLEKPGQPNRNAAAKDSCPTVVIEIALSESAKKLGRDCGRWSGASEGKVKMAIGIKIYLNKKNLQHITARNVVKIVLHEWTVISVNEDDKTTTLQQCGRLRRTDKKRDSQQRVSLAEQYTFSVSYGTRIATWLVGRFSTIIYGKGTRTHGPQSIQILNCDIYRTHNVTEEDLRTFSEIPYSTIVEAVMKGCKRQVSADSLKGSVKRTLTQAELDEQFEENAANARTATLIHKARRLRFAQDAGPSSRNTGSENPQESVPDFEKPADSEEKPADSEEKPTDMEEKPTDEEIGEDFNEDEVNAREAAQEDFVYDDDDSEDSEDDS